MKISVENIGCIKNAKVEIKGLTVIAGENGTGKSTISKMLFSIIKAVANLSQENEDAQQRLLEKYARTLYQRISMFDIRHANKQTREIFPISSMAFAHKVWERRDTDDIEKYFDTISNFISKLEELSPRTKNLALKDITSMRNLLSHKNKAYQLASEIRSFVESEFMNQITTYGQEYSKVEFLWDESNDYGLVFEIENDEMGMVGCSLDNPLDDATYIESPLYLPLMDSLRRSATYVENLRSTILQPMSPLHVKDIINKYDLLSHYLQDKETLALLEKISLIINGRFIYDEKKRFIYFKNNKGQRLMPINVASGVKTFGVLQVLLQIGAIGANKPLFWDEPENHLHPDWQVKFAEMLVALCKAGYPIVISTHSPYFIQSIRFFAAKYQVSQFVNYYLAEKGDDELASIEEVSTDLNRIFTKLSAPLNFVMNIPNEQQ